MVTLPLVGVILLLIVWAVYQDDGSDKIPPYSGRCSWFKEARVGERIFGTSIHDRTTLFLRLDISSSWRLVSCDALTGERVICSNPRYQEKTNSRNLSVQLRLTTEQLRNVVEPSSRPRFSGCNGGLPVLRRYQLSAWDHQRSQPPQRAEKAHCRVQSRPRRGTPHLGVRG
jgi:hypothetical protein